MSESNKPLFFDGSGGCKVCQSKTGYVTDPNFVGHLNCDCPAPLAKNDDRDPVDHRYEDIQISSYGFEIRGPITGEYIKNNGADADLSLTVSGSFSGEYPQEASFASGYAFILQFNESVETFVQRGATAAALAYCTVEWKVINATKINIYEDGSEEVVGPIVDEMTIVLTDSLRVEGKTTNI